MDQQIYSNTVNVIGETEITLWSAWQDTVLVGVAPVGGNNTKSWLRQGEFIEINGSRWVMLDLQRAATPDAATLMIHLVRVEPEA